MNGQKQGPNELSKAFLEIEHLAELIGTGANTVFAMTMIAVLSVEVDFYQSLPDKIKSQMTFKQKIDREILKRLKRFLWAQACFWDL